MKIPPCPEISRGGYSIVAIKKYPQKQITVSRSQGLETEERGQRKEDRGKKKEERRKRKEKKQFCEVVDLCHESRNQTIPVYIAVSGIKTTHQNVEGNSRVNGIGGGKRV